MAFESVLFLHAPRRRKQWGPVRKRESDRSFSSRRARRSVFFFAPGDRYVVWASFSEASFDAGPFDRDGEVIDIRVL